MILPQIIQELINTQNRHDAEAYSKCFSKTAVVFDEGKKHKGRDEIKQWINESNENYKSIMEPIAFEEFEEESILKAKISGTFPGSPIQLEFHFRFSEGLIESLKIT